MRVAVDRHFVTVREHSLNHRGIELGVATNHEEGRLDTTAGQEIKDQMHAHARAIRSDRKHAGRWAFAGSSATHTVSASKSKVKLAAA